jgi:polyphosphate kinase
LTVGVVELVDALNKSPPLPLGESASPFGPNVPDRERAILDFNRRVLAQAQRANVPLLERLRYVTIVSSNLDEFFEIRMADRLDATRKLKDPVGRASFDALSEAAHQLIADQYAVLNEAVMPQLRENGIVVLSHLDRDRAQRRWVAEFFNEQVKPLLVPVSLDPSHPFPLVANKSLNFIARLSGKDAFGRRNAVAIVKVPRVLPRVIRLPEAISNRRQVFVLLTSVIRAHLADLFPGRTVMAFSQFRVTRDADFDVDAGEVGNLRQALRGYLTKRPYGQAIRLEVVSTCPSELSNFLLTQFDLPALALYKVNGPVNLVRLNQLIDLADVQTHRFPHFEPTWPVAVNAEQGLFEQLRKQDVLLHHPFESFDPVLQFLREAVHDPKVLAIKQTIYRTGAQSLLMELLIEAARRGKEVLAVVELQARFDEEANINWAERLEAVGAQVVYGIVGLKTHAKLLLVTRQEFGKLRRYVHLSTGNYNPRTARMYTDMGYLSADAALTADAEAVFLQIASQVPMHKPKVLSPAPFVLHQRMLKHLRQVAAAAQAGFAARVVVKVNALTDAALIDALVAAAKQGASIDLIVRGACLLPSALAHQHNIRVRSVVGRFLEHSRIMYFRWGSRDKDEALYLSSADWMSRNMFGRIEIAWPVRDAALRQRVIDEGLVPYLHDTQDAWVCQADGRYRPTSDAVGHSAQTALMARYSRT